MARNRSEFPKKVKAQAALRANGRCEDCGAVLRAGGYQFDHDKADGLGGEPTLENCKVRCTPCHKSKTHEHDNPMMQKADRVKKKIMWGIRDSQTPMPHGKNSPTKRKFDGTIVDRRTGEAWRGSK